MKRYYLKNTPWGEMKQAEDAVLSLPGKPLALQPETITHQNFRKQNQLISTDIYIRVI